MTKKLVTKDLNDLTFETSSQHILLEEYRALHSDYIQQRSEGVTRMNFFVTAISVILGGILIFASGNNATMIFYFRHVLLAALIILTTIGIDVYLFLIQRNIDIDQDIRGMARVRIYFVKHDPGLEKFFVTGIYDSPSKHITNKGSGMRRSAEIIVSFLVGIALVTLSSYFPLTLEINIAIGVSMTILTALLLDLFAQRKLGKALSDAQKEMKFNINVTPK